MAAPAFDPHGSPHVFCAGVASRARKRLPKPVDFAYLSAMRFSVRPARWLGCFASGLLAFAVSAMAGDWAERFAQPPASSRILKIIHNWPDAPEAQDQLITRLRAQGFGGVVCNVSFTDYLESEPRWAAFGRAVKAAKDAGFALWLYDERGYPSGNAGGLVLRDHPEWEASGLLIADTESTGGEVTLTAPPGRVVLAAAYPVRAGQLDLRARVDLAGRMDAGKLTWTAPSGHWRVMVITESRLFEGTHAAGNLHAKLAYPNLLLPEPTARFVELTYGGYARHLGDDLGRYFEATFTDEPSLMSLFLQPMPYRPLPWAANLPGEFQRRRGRKLDLALLPALVADAGPETARLRYDFWLTVGELVAENYFGQIQNRCRKLGVPSGGHLLAEEGLVGHVPLYGDFFRCIRRLDAPSIDCLTSVPAEVPWFIARLLASAAELEGREVVMSETSDHSQVYRPAGDARPKRVVTEAEIRGTANREMVAGVNTLTSYYSFNGLDDAALRRLNDWVGRFSAALRGGSQVADIAVLYPVESVWVRFQPSHQWARDAAALRVEHQYRAASDSLFAAQRDFTFVDSRALIEAQLKGDALVHGTLRWRVVVLPGADTLPLEAWQKLDRFVRAGGIVVALGELPANTETQFPAAAARKVAKSLFGVEIPNREPCSRANRAGGAGIFLPRGSESLLPLALDGVLEPDVRVVPARSPVRVTHRRIEAHEVYFVINDSGQPWSGEIGFAARGEGERWDPATGQREALSTSDAQPVKLEAYGAAVFRFAVAQLPARRPATGKALPNMVLRELPRVQPVARRGEFVRADLAGDPAKPTAAWSVNATLTRSKVDTFLFAEFHYEPLLDLSGADCLAMETAVPDGQSTANHLLVILREADGGDFIAETSRPLGTPGREVTFVPLDSFRLAGWSKDADGVLDRRRIQDVRIGWGGYLGEAGETVRFELGAPQAGTVSAK